MPDDYPNDASHAGSASLVHVAFHIRYPLRMRQLALFVFVLSLSGCAIRDNDRSMTSSSSWILSGGTIYTGNPESPFEPATILIRGDRIAYVGSESEALVRAGSDPRRVDVSGRTILPGLIDAHAHLAGLGESLETVSLVGSRSVEEMLARVAEAHARLPEGEWLIGRGWDQNEWPVKEFPTAAALDEVVGDRPVWLTRIDGHAGLASSAALRLAGVTRSTPDPDGGRILRSPDGSIAGVFVDNAMNIVGRAIPPASRERLKERLAAAAIEVARHGLTAIHDAGADQQTIDLLMELDSEGRLPIRVYVMLEDNASLLESWFARGPLIDRDGRVQVRSIKLYADGALGSRGAALIEPYSDEPHNRGLLLTTPEHITEVARRARAAGFQVGTHAIGDRGTKTVLDAYAAAGVRPEDRFRIEHLQVATLDDLARTARMGIIASMQPTHATSDMNWAEDRVGPERILGAYAWKSLADAGAVLAFGSDFPVEYVDPFLGIRAAVERRDVDGNPPGGWQAQERVTLSQAIDGFTRGAAYASFTEEVQGRIREGYLADFTIVDASPAELTSVPEPAMTIVGGTIVYDGGNSTSSNRVR